MPFTLAHPAAVIPLRRFLGDWTVPSALVVGSITPDLAYMFPVGIPRGASHSLAGLLWFCLPAGASVYLLFHLVLKQPLVSLASTNAGRRLSVITMPGLPAAPWSAVLVSLLLGASTHLAWDAFTHESGVAVRAFAPLRAEVFLIGSYRVFVYKVLQHGSSVFGLCVLAWWTLAWQRETSPGQEAPVTLTQMERLFAVSLLIAIPAIAGLGVAWAASSAGIAGSELPLIARKAVLSFFSVFASFLLVFSVWWNLRRRLRHV